MNRGYYKVEPLNKSGAENKKLWPQLKDVNSWATTQLGCSKSGSIAFFPCLQLLLIVTHHSIVWRNISDWIFSQQKNDWLEKRVRRVTNCEVETLNWMSGGLKVQIQLSLLTLGGRENELQNSFCSYLTRKLRYFPGSATGSEKQNYWNI